MTTTATVPATQQKAVSKTERLRDIMNNDKIQEQFKNALKENSSLFVASLIDLYNGDAYLQNCEPKEVVMEALKAAVLKLPINKSLGFAWIIPYNNNVKDTQTGGWKKVLKPTFQIGYKGYIQLAMRTGQYRIINTDKVHEGELKSVNKLTGEIDFSGAKKSDTVVGYFAYIELINGFTKTLYVTTEEVKAHAMKFSKSYGQKNSAWETNFDGMAMKTVVSNLLSHYGFLSVEMVGAMDTDISTDAKDTHKEEIRQYANEQTVDFEETPQQQVDESTGEINEPETKQEPGF